MSQRHLNAGLTRHPFTETDRESVTHGSSPPSTYTCHSERSEDPPHLSEWRVNLDEMAGLGYLVAMRRKLEGMARHLRFSVACQVVPSV
jgi:hypothetical protein